MQIAAKTNFGRIRQINQDYYIVEELPVGIFPNLFLVADGVSSNVKSGYASKHSCEFVLDQLKRTKVGDNYIEEMEKVYRLANTDLFYRILANVEFSGMGTTLVMGTIDNDKLIVGNVGDSRCYHIRDEIVQITRDHTVAEELVFEKAIEKDSNTYNEYKHQLTRAIGAEKKIKPDFFEKVLLKGDYILFCTDGLTNMVSDEDIYNIVTSEGSVEEKIDSLIRLANDKGGIDNIAVILIYIDYIDENRSEFYKDDSKLTNQNKKIFDLLKEQEKMDSMDMDDIRDLQIDVSDILNRDRIIKSDLTGRSRKKKNDEEDINKLERKEEDDE